VIDLRATPQRWAAAAIWLRAGLRMIVLLLGLWATYRWESSSHEDYLTGLWWFQQEADSWVTGGLAGEVGRGALGGRTTAAAAATILVVGFVCFTVLYGLVGTWVGHGSHRARVIAFVWTSLGVLELTLVIWWFPPAARDLSVLPLGTGAVADVVGPAVQWAWPPILMTLDVAILALLLLPSPIRNPEPVPAPDPVPSG